MRRRATLVGVALLMLGAACGGDDAGDAAPTTTSSTTTSSTTTSSTTTSTVDPPPPEITTIEIEVGELVFDARTAGPDDGELVVLLHGFPQTSAMWKAQLRALGDAGYRAVAPDQRGYSSGARPPDVDDYTLDLLTADTVGMADALGADQFHLVGHDWGGGLAWVVADAHADRLHTLTVVSTPHVGAMADTLADSTTDQGDRSGYVETLVQPGSELAFVANDAAILRSLYADAGLSAEEMQDQLDVLADPDAMRSALNWYRANAFAGGEVIGPATMPTLFIWSDGDQFLGPDAAAATVDHVTGPYRFEVLEGVNHWVPEVAADDVNALLLDFLANPSAT